MKRQSLADRVALFASALNGDHILDLAVVNYNGGQADQLRIAEFDSFSTCHRQKLERARCSRPSP